MMHETVFWIDRFFATILAVMWMWVAGAEMEAAERSEER
jgi:hypothetical protein